MQQRFNKKENSRPITLLNTDTNIPNKVLANWVQEHKKITCCVQTDSIPVTQGWFNTFKPIHLLINKCNPPNRLKVRNHKIIRYKWDLWLDPTSLHDKSPGESWNMEDIPQYKENLQVKVMLNGEKLKAFLLKSGLRQRCSLFPYLLHIVQCLSYHNKITGGDQGVTNRKVRYQIILIYRRYDFI